jgi:hypothetical protein
MLYEITPYKGAGHLLLGALSEDIQEICGEKPEKFKKLQDDEYYTDFYTDFCCFFKKPGICDAIEFHNPAVVIYNNISLLGEPYNKVKESLLQLDKDIIFDGDGLTSLKLGLGVYAPDADEDNPSYVAEGVIVFEKGYYK